ncbi:MAG: uracil-DNA glycosylase family protein [Bryobacteraceae bacterium]|nr:uracil-DNA glycosylase family protein [Bryobacteraceae bacterium]
MSTAYRPEAVRLLFIGESPPASGRCFYQRDSGLYRAMLEAFRAADPRLDGDCFLEVFQSSGCYLVDLCPEPVDHLPTPVRRARCREGEALLAKAIAELQPKMIATVVRSIETNAARAAAAAAYHGPLLHLPYPGRWSRFRRVFVAKLAPVIEGLARA